MKKNFKLKNCFDDVCKVSLEMENVKYIFKETISGDEILIVVYKDNNVETYDSDMHCRCTAYSEGIEIIYPDKIDLWGEYLSPDEKDNFKCVKKGEQLK